jgi:hypothetical protein
MKKDEMAPETDNDGGEKGIFVGEGAAANYPALMLLLAGGVLSGVALYDSVNRGGNYIAFIIAALLCAFISFALIMKKGSKK